MKKSFLVVFTLLIVSLMTACGGKKTETPTNSSTVGQSTGNTQVNGEFEIAPGIKPLNNLYGNKTVAQWKETYKDIIDIDGNSNGVADWKEQNITLTWAVSKGDLGDDPMNNLLWRHAQKFTEHYPNITIVRDNRFITTSDKEDVDLYVVASQEGNMPDVIYAPLAAEIYDQDLTLDLTPYYRTDPEAGYIAQNIMDFNTSFDGKEMVTSTYRTVSTKMLSVNVGLLKENNIPIPDYDWTYEEYEQLRSKVGELTNAGECVFPGIYNWSEIGPRYFDGLPGGWKGYNIETQRFELAKATNFGKWLEIEAEESVDGWHFGDLTKEQQTAICNNLASPYADGFQAIDSSVPYWSIGNSIVENYILTRGLEIDLYPIPQAPAGGETINYGYADTYALGYHLANNRVKAQAAFELVRYLSYAFDGLKDKYNFIYEDIAKYGETPDDWAAKGNDISTFPQRHPYHDLIAYTEGYPATSNPKVLEVYPLIKGFGEDSWFSNYNFDAFKNAEMQRQLSEIVLFPRNLPAFNNVQSELNTWRIRDQIRDEGYYYEDVIAEWDTLMNGHLDNYLQNYSKLN